MNTILQYIAYWAAWLQLRSLEINLQGMCNSLPGVICIETRANTTLAMRRLSLEVIAARNRFNALRPVRRMAGWRSIA